MSLHVTEQGTDAFNVAGRGEMHLSILMETMRREGYEFSVSTPRVLTKEIDGKLCEPIERMVADVPEESMGAVIEKMGKRKGDLLGMTPVGSRIPPGVPGSLPGPLRLPQRVPDRYPGRGYHVLRAGQLRPHEGRDRAPPSVGSLIAFETGEAVRLWPVQCPGAGHTLHRRRHAGLCRHGGWRVPAGTRI